MLKITRTLQKQIDEKTETIDKYNAKLKQLEREFAEEQKELNERFDNEKQEMQRKNDQEQTQQEKQMRTLLKAQE